MKLNRDRRRRWLRVEHLESRRLLSRGYNISINDVRVVEPSDAGPNAVSYAWFTVTAQRKGPSDQIPVAPLALRYSVMNGGGPNAAQVDKDVVAGGVGWFQIAPNGYPEGTYTAQVLAIVRQDLEDEPDEQFNVVVSDFNNDFSNTYLKSIGVDSATVGL